MKKVIIYTDGACSYNPGPGGWCAILNYNGVFKQLSGGEIDTTNNRMELMAVIKSLEALNVVCEVEVFSDSAYVVNAFNLKWIYNWKKNNWVSNKKAVKNIDLWQKLLALTEKQNVKFIKVKGHSDNEYNNACDIGARAEVDKILSDSK